MCEPVSATTLAIAAVATAAVGTGVAVYGQMQAADAQKQQEDYQAAVARNNGILAQRAADDARARGEQQAANDTQQYNQLKGRQRAVLASNGVLVDTGSALDLTTDTAGQAKLDELTVRNNAEREALGFEAQGMNFNANASLDTLAGNNAQAAGTTAAFGSLISGAGSVAGKWYGFNKDGVAGF